MGEAESREEPELFRAKFRIMGDVQGVGMRAWIQSEAISRGLNGWVRNEADQSVAALFIGSQTALTNIKDWLAQGTPHAAIIDVCELELDSIDMGWSSTAGFDIRQSY